LADEGGAGGAWAKSVSPKKNVNTERINNFFI
jgi:hypothetical protein